MLDREEVILSESLQTKVCDPGILGKEYLPTRTDSLGLDVEIIQLEPYILVPASAILVDPEHETTLRETSKDIRLQENNFLMMWLDPC